MQLLLSNIRQRPATWFYLSWLLINLVQSYGTELLHDEAYYWVYSRFLDWGYFDHPPMIAILIKIGYLLFPNELGVRLGVAILNTATLWLVQQLLVKKDDLLFYAIAASMGVLQIGGILAVPDLPLTFFTALFFWQYRAFINNKSWINALILGFVMAGMLYSKYHGLLIILFTIASNWKLMLNPRAWVAVITGVLLFFPHLYWQYEHGFPSVMYHLKERNAPAYQFAFSLEYVGGQVLLAGPLIGYLLLRAANRFKTQDQFTKALQWSMWGFYGFFLLSTLKGRVEANWTVPALVPLIILSHAWIAEHAADRKWIFRLLTPSLAVVLIVRLYLITDISILTRKVKDELHNNQAWANSIKAASNGLPVVFMSSYQRPSKYWFYSGDTSFAINTTNYRRTNFNFWPMERNWQNKKVFLVDNYMSDWEGATPIETARGKTWGYNLPVLHSSSFIQLNCESTPVVASANKPLNLRVVIAAASLSDWKQLQPNLFADVFNNKELIQRIMLTVEDEENAIVTLSSSEALKLQPGKYILKLGLATSITGHYSQNSPATPLIVQ